MKIDKCIHGERCKSWMWYYQKDRINRCCNRCKYYVKQTAKNLSGEINHEGTKH